LLNTFFNIVEYKKEDEQKGDRLLDKSRRKNIINLFDERRILIGLHRFLLHY